MADYIYGSANVRALEAGIIGRERIARLLEVKSTEDAYRMLSEFGIPLVTDPESGAVLREATLLGILKNTYAHMAELAPQSDALSLWLCPYDCNNLKAAIKASARGIDPSSMLFDFGSVPAEEIAEMAAHADFSKFPPSLCRAVEKAAAEFSKTKNPQVVDLILDRACYAEMSAAAIRSGNEYVLSLVKTKADLTNLMIVVRILRMKSGSAGEALLEEALVEGGSLSREALLAFFREGEEKLWKQLRRNSRYAALEQAVAATDGSLAALERVADDFLMEKIKTAKYCLGGVEIMVAFLLAHEYEVKNLRILLAGKEAGLPAATIRERIRESYV